MMLEEVMRYVNNRFDCETVYGMFEVSEGGIELPDALEGQYFWVEGSRLNDGLHGYPAHDMRSESFEGKVTLLAVPRAFEDLADEIGAWNDANAKVIDSPLQSESFGGYSYSRASGGTQGNEMPAAAWQLHFGARLRPYRKLNRDWN